MKKYAIASDKRLNPELQEAVGDLRGGILGQAKNRPCPKRFSYVSDENSPAMIITDNETGRTSTVPLFAFGNIINCLNDLFS